MSAGTGVRAALRAFPFAADGIPRRESIATQKVGRPKMAAEFDDFEKEQTGTPSYD